MYGISGSAFYALKTKFVGMEPQEAKQLKAPENENARLKRLLAEAILYNKLLKDLPS
jgi:putative transposase